MQVQRLSHEAINRLAPSVFAESPFHKMSDRYAFVPTFQVMQFLESEGWFPSKVQQNYTRVPGKTGFARHMIRFTRDGAPLIVGDTVPQIVLTNSHDGSSGYLMDAGLFRLVCSNGMTVSEGTFESIKVHHRGDIKDRIIEASYRILDNTPLLAQSVQEFKETHVTPEMQQVFAAAAMELKWPKEETVDEETGTIIKVQETANIEPRQLLQVRRYADNPEKANLWGTFNVVQENLIKGGLRGRASTGRRTSTREVKSVSEDVRLNKALWTLATEMSKIING